MGMHGQHGREGHDRSFVTASDEASIARQALGSGAAVDRQILLGATRRPREADDAMTTRRVAIVGASTSDCGRVDDKTAFQLNFQGTTRALADAGIDKSEVDGFMSLTGALPPVELAEYLGLRPNWVDSTGHGGSIWEFMVEHAAAALAQGLVEVVVLTYGSTQRADLKKKLRMANLSFGTRGPDSVRRTVRSSGGIALRHGGPTSYVRVRHHH